MSLFTLTGTLTTHGDKPLAGTPLIITPSPSTTVDADAEVIREGGDVVVTDDTGYFTIDLATVPGLTYTVRSTAGGRYKPRRFDAPAAGTVLDLTKITPIPAPSPMAEYVRGASAYDLAVSAGFDGTEAEWLASLNGRDGAEAQAKTRSLYHLNGYETFFDSVAGWVDGQGVISTTTPGAAAGATTIPVAATIGLLPGVQILTGRATPEQTVHVITAVDTGTVTVTKPLPYALPAGAAVTPLWNNSTHLGPNGYIAFAYWIANATDPDSGAPIITGTTPTVTVLGNSWISQGGTAYADQIKARIPGATVINAGVAGNTSTQLLARFDTDVPPGTDYVVFNEPGVNDDTSGAPLEQQAANLEALVAKSRAIGAIPIYTGHVPLKATPAAATRQAATKAAIGSGFTFPGTSWPAVLAAASTTPDVITTPEPESLGVGDGTLGRVTTATQNTAVGKNAGRALTIGTSNTFVGREAGTACAAGSSNTGLGHNALRVVGSGVGNTAVGQGAGASATGNGGTFFGRNTGILVSSGNENTLIGHQAGFAPGGVTADATTTGTRQTAIGVEAGQKGTAQLNLITAIGYRARSGGHYAVAIGADVVADGAGAVAIGADNTGAAAQATRTNQIALGTAAHTVDVPGRLNVAQRTPSGTADPQGRPGDIATDDDYVYVKTAAGWKRAALSTW